MFPTPGNSPPYTTNDGESEKTLAAGKLGYTLKVIPS